MEHSNDTINILSLFWQADFFVKLVMLSLVAASVWSWTIIGNKILLFSRYNRKTNYFTQLFWNKNTVVDELFNFYSQKKQQASHCPMSLMFHAGYAEYKRLSKTSPDNGELLNAIERSMVSSMNKDIDRMEHSLIILSSVSSSAPFVGLLGTVWGIMNSFTAIASSQQTNLAVVAPGIAEALFATALGLIAAIPANIAYNRLTNDVSRHISSLESFRHDFLTLISRSFSNDYPARK